MADDRTDDTLPTDQPGVPAHDTSETPVSHDADMRAAAVATAEPETQGRHAAARPSGLRRWWAALGGRELLELAVLTGFALTQPLLSETGKAPEFFSYRRLSSLSMVWFVLVVTFVPPLALWAVERLVALVSKAAERIVHLVFVAALLALLLIELGKDDGLPQGVALAVVASLVAVGLTVALVRSATLRLYLKYASPAPLVFALLFVMTSPSGAIVRNAVSGSTTTLATPVGGATSATTPASPPAAGAAPTSASDVEQAQQAEQALLAPGAKTIQHPDVVMIFFDEFPLKTLLKSNGQVNAALYPNFAWLSKNTTWFRNATGVSGFTPYAVPAMLRGKFPAKGLPPVYQSYPDNVLAELGGTYSVSAMETITALCPPKSCKATATSKPTQATGLAATLKDSGSQLEKIISPYKDKSDPTTEFADSGSTDFQAADTTTAATGSGNATTGADEPAATCTSTTCLFKNLGADQPSRMKAFVNTLTPTPSTSKPTFRFLHVLLPHGPWHYDQNGRPYPYPAVGPGHSNNGGWLDQAWPVQVNLAREALQLSYADKLLGDVLTKLRTEGTLDKTMLIVTADHGEGFIPGDQARAMDKATAADLSWVPMFLKMPHQVHGKLDERNWSHVDLVATLADALHVKFPQQLDGVSGLGPARTTTTKYWYNSPGKQLTIADPVGTYKNDVVKGFGGLIGDARSAADLYKLGPRADLIGKKVSAVRAGGAAAYTLSVNGAVKGTAAKVTATSAVPTLVYGHLNGKTAGLTVAIAVNGVIGAVVPTYADNGAPVSIEALVQPTLYHSGANTISAYVVTGTGAATQLHPVKGA